MPNLSSSKKALRQSIKRGRANTRLRSRIKKALKSSRPDLKQVQSLIDKAAKVKALPKNKANRLKSELFRKLNKG